MDAEGRENMLKSGSLYIKVKIFCDLDQNLYMYNVPQSVRKKLADRYRCIEFIYKNIEDAVSEGMQDEKVEVYWGNRITADVEIMFPNLRWVHFGSVGIDKMSRISEGLKKRLIVTNSDGTFENGIIDHTLYQITWLFRGGESIERMRQCKKLNRQEHEKSISNIKEIAASKFLVLGYGRIAKKIVNAIKALGGTVDVIKRNIEEIEGSKVYQLCDLSRIAVDYDCIIGMLPGSSDLVEVFNYENLFSRMKAKSYFINNGRGEHINETDLVKVLECKKILGAAIDVTPIEPLPPNSRLKHIDNLLVTPHIAAIDMSYWDNQYKLLNKNLECYIEKNYSKMENMKLA